MATWFRARNLTWPHTKPRAAARAFSVCFRAMKFVLNGEPTQVALSDPNLTLLAWLRQTGRTGTKEGCAEGECGACAVAMVERDAEGRAVYRALNSCLVPLASVADRFVITVEGVAERDALHPVQAALVEHGASQCGYCTPGFVISMFCEFYRPDREHAQAEAIAGNLCRCTGYRPLLAALSSLPAAGDDRHRAALASTSQGSAVRSEHAASQPLSSAQQRSEPAHEASLWLRPRTLGEFFALRAAHPEATPIAGGTDLMVDVNQRDRRFRRLIALEALPELRRFELTEDELVLGAGLSLSELEQRLERERAPRLLRALFPLFASRLIRNRATLGGNLATASPIGDAAPCLLALDASVTLLSPRGARQLALEALFVGYRRTELAPDELIASVHVPLPSAPRQRFYKLSKRVLDDISTVAGAFALALDDDRVRNLRIAYGGVAATPLRARSLEQLAVGRRWDRDTLSLLCERVHDVGTPLSDARGSAGYRRAMMARLLEKFWHDTSEARDDT